MTRLRDDVRNAFEREQSRLGDIGDARPRLVRGAMARTQPVSRGLQWAAAIAAILIAAIVITTLALVKAGGHSTTVPAAPSPTPLTNELSVPDSVPVILYYDPVNPTQVDGMTWDGKTRGRVSSVSDLTQIANPANSLFANDKEIHDRSGKLTAAGSFGAKYFWGTWADDETHFCILTPFDYPGPNGVATTLELRDARVGGGRVIARVGHYYQQTAIWVAACSIQFDRAVVVQSGGQGVGTNQYWVIQLSTGKLLWTHSFDLSGLPVQIISSRDGQYIAEEQTAPPTGNMTTWNSTVMGPDGTAMAHITGAVITFCWDGSLAVVDGGGGGDGPAQIVRIADGTVIWSGPAGAGYGVKRAFAEPDGANLAIAVNNPAYPKTSSQVDLYVVAPSGKEIAVLKGVSM